jgi:DNA-binding GntR family transcriptional regulator
MSLASPTAAPIERKLLSNQIADALRRDILFGILKPGTKISQQQLCEVYNVSRMPVRDALRALVHEGLMLVDEGRHIIVAPLSRADLLDAYTIEGVLTGLAAERASERATPAELDELDNLHDGMLTAASTDDRRQMVELNWQLHRGINRMARSRKLLLSLRKVSLDLPRDYLEHVPNWSSRSNTEHASILAAMRHRRHTEANQLMREHVENSGRGLVEFLESQGLELD